MKSLINKLKRLKIKTDKLTVDKYLSNPNSNYPVHDIYEVNNVIIPNYILNLDEKAYLDELYWGRNLCQE